MGVETSQQTLTVNLRYYHGKRPGARLRMGQWARCDTDAGPTGDQPDITLGRDLQAFVDTIKEFLDQLSVGQTSSCRAGVRQTRLPLSSKMLPARVARGQARLLSARCADGFPTDERP
jgi:hypothetical protein